MTYITQTEANSGVFGGFLTALTDFFASFRTAQHLASTYDARMRQADRLQAMSDSELAYLGISRDLIMHHVFAEVYHTNV